MRWVKMTLSLIVSIVMVLTHVPMDAQAAPAREAGVSTLCDSSRCMSLLDAYGAKKVKHKATHKRPSKRPGASRPGSRPGYRPGKPNRPGITKPGRPGKPGAIKPNRPNKPGANKPGKPTKPDYKPGKPNKPGTNKPGKPTRPDYKPGKPNKPDFKPNRPGRPKYRPSNWHHRPVYYRPYYRPWRHQDWYGAVIAGVVLGSIIAVAANTPPPAPSSDLCWYWSNDAQTKGYWDYCY